MVQSKLAEQTQYPDIFEWTFWSQYCSNKLDQQEIVINNRNSFVSTHHVLELIDDVVPRHIQRFTYVQSAKHKKIHNIEVYKTQNHPYIVVSSPVEELTVLESQALIADGWHRTPRLFYPNLDSWIHLNPNMKRNDIPQHLDWIENELD